MQLELYWSCGECSNWFHPSCIDENDEPQPANFVCDVCLDSRPKKIRKTKKAKRSVIDLNADEAHEDDVQELKEALPTFSLTDIEIKNIIPFASDDAKEEELVGGFMFVCTSYVIEKVNAVNKFVEDLIKDTYPNRTEDTEHDMFMKNPSREFLKGYGLGYVSDMAIVYIDAYVQKKFFKLKLRDKRYEGAVRQMRYKEALVRDIITLLVSSKLRLSFGQAKQKCSQTEDKSLLKATQKGEQLRAERMV